MAEQRKKSHSLLLREGNKILASVDLFPASAWSDQTEAQNLFRVRINNIWHCPFGKYSFFTSEGVGEMVEALLTDGVAPTEEPAPDLPHKAMVSVIPPNDVVAHRGFVHAPPHQEKDGIWYVWILLPDGLQKLPACDVTLVRRVR